MKTSGELRHSFQGRDPRKNASQSALERIDSHVLSPTEQKVVDAIEARIREGGASLVGSGRSADVVILDIWDDAQASSHQPWVIKQEHTRTDPQELLDISLTDEMVLQEKAFHCIHTTMQRATSAHGATESYARIPLPLSIFTDQQRRWFIMEYIRGDTLFERALKVYLHAIHGHDEQLLVTQKRPELLSLLQRTTEYTAMSPDTKACIEDSIYLGQPIDERIFPHLLKDLHAAQQTLLPVAHVLALRQSLTALHHAGIYHRDLHPSNILLEPNGGVAIIDFGLAVHDPSAPSMSTESRHAHVYTPSRMRGYERVTVSLVDDTAVIRSLIPVVDRSA